MSVTATIATIVEGHGEVTALPVVITRIAVLVAPGVQIGLPPPIRVKRDRFLRNADEFRRIVELACRRVTGPGGVLVLLDSDGQCHQFNGPALLMRARSVRADREYAVVFAHHEYETWFAAAAESLAVSHLLPGTAAPLDPEKIGAKKGWVKAHMRNGHYAETVDQERLSRDMDIVAARRNSPSFDKLCRDVARLAGGPSPS